MNTSHQALFRTLLGSHGASPMLSHGLPQMSFCRTLSNNLPSLWHRLQQSGFKVLGFQFSKHRDLDGVQQKPQGGCKHLLGGVFDYCVYCMSLHLNEWLGGHLYKTPPTMSKHGFYDCTLQSYLPNVIVCLCSPNIPCDGSGHRSFIEYGMLSKHPHHK